MGELIVRHCVDILERRCVVMSEDNVSGSRGQVASSIAFPRHDHLDEIIGDCSVD